MYHTNKRSKREILTTVVGRFASGVIGIAYEGILTFLHHKRHKALQKAVKAIKKRSDMQANKIYHLEDSMIMYGSYNSSTLTSLIDIIHKIYNATTTGEKKFAGVLCKCLRDELIKTSNQYNCTIDSLLFLTTIREKYVMT